MAGRLPSVMGRSFSNIPAPQIQRSVFNRSHGHKTTFNGGQLVPFFVDEILPGDTVSLTAQVFARLSTMIFPIMDNVFLDTFFFFVPNRLVWDNWERFQGAQDDPDDSIDFEVPQLTVGNFGANSLGDYFGLPTVIAYPAADYPSALPFRSYNLIYNEWFRDQNLQDSLVVDKDDGPDTQTDYVIRNRGKRHDYFTSCLPWPQKGDSVSLPLGTSAPVFGTGKSLGLTNGSETLGIVGVTGTATGLLADEGGYNVDVGFLAAANPIDASGTLGVVTSGVSGLYADLASATAATVNQLREAFAIQQILEMDARGGTRYVEHLRAHWGVVSPDFRLQRPEYLGGSSQRVDVRGVPQTSSTDATTPQGNLSSYAQVGNRSGFHRSFVEHGHIIGLVNVRADITYQEGMRRMWSRRTRFDFYMPELAHLGEQAVLNKEIYFQATADNLLTFGYQERWAEYRYFPSIVTGLFRTNAAGSLDAWHLALDFSALPVLNDTFIVDAPPLDRVIAVDNEPHVLMDSYFDIRHARPMPVYSVPGLQRL